MQTWLSSELYRIAGEAEANDPDNAGRYHNAADCIRTSLDFAGFTNEEKYVGLCKVLADIRRVMEVQDAKG